jgi:hypothetical protein
MSSEAVMVDVSEHIGQWKVVLLLLLGCNYAIVGINHTLPTFQGYTPYYFCQVIHGYENRTPFTWPWDITLGKQKGCGITLQ